ncbi:MAG: hypothetical protein JWN76_3597 [Chitinophagaceae bacterium]|nr:hypothetical protein [Chitinophagaceae bacterium]
MKNLTLSIAFILVAAFANAQSQSATNNQTVTLSLADKIDITNVTGNNPTLTFASTADYASGIALTNASSFQVRSNKPWNLTVKANAANFSGPVGNTMPSSALQVKKNGAGSFVGLSTTDQTLVSGGTRGVNTVAVDYNANPGFNYDGGSYTLVVVYTATQQ